MVDEVRFEARAEISCDAHSHINKLPGLWQAVSVSSISHLSALRFVNILGQRNQHVCWRQACQPPHLPTALGDLTHARHIFDYGE